MVRRSLDIAAHLIAGPSKKPLYPPSSIRSFTHCAPQSPHILPRDHRHLGRYDHLLISSPHVRQPGYKRLKSTSAPIQNTQTSEEHPAGKLTEEEQRAYERLRPIISALPGPVDWAVAYGSGVRHQANADPSGKPPMTDFLLSTPSLVEFHTANLRQNPSHYPLTARLLGGARIAWLTDNWGAGVWYVTMVKIRGLEVKYGIISSERLRRDLEGWETLYVAGRLHKPVLPLLTPPSISPSLQTNLHTALALSLLLLPATFTESALWTQIAGISYAGDPRMSVPGAEHPDKIANIVKGKGALEGMRALYGGFLGTGQLGVTWESDGNGEKAVEWGWKGTGEDRLRQPESPDHLASLILSLPPTLRSKIAKHYSSAPESETGKDLPSEKVSKQSSEEKALWVGITSGKIPIVSSPGGDWRKVVLQEIASIIRRPATTQSLKGLFTAGFRKSFVYALAKFKKWLSARQGGKKAQ